MEERRRFVRVDASSIWLNYYQATGEGESAQAQIARNISQGGIRFPVNEKLPAGTTLELQLQLPGDVGRISAKVAVAWCTRFFPSKARYEVGCRFIEIDPIDRGKIIHYIHETLKERKPWP